MLPEQRFTVLGGYRVHSVHAGAGDPVVLLHGLSGSHRWWHSALQSLSKRYSVHVPELVGFGASRPVPRQPSIPEAAQLIIDWMDSVGIERCALVGHSMGGQIAIHIAARAPERVTRLVLVSAAGIPRPISFSEAFRFLTEMVPPRAWGYPGFLPVIALDALRAGPLTLLRAIRYLVAADVRPLLPQIGMPTLLIWGRSDPLTPLEHGRRMQQGIPGARLVVLEAAHVPMADKPAQFLAALEAFLAESH